MTSNLNPWAQELISPIVQYMNLPLCSSNFSITPPTMNKTSLISYNIVLAPLQMEMSYVSHIMEYIQLICPPSFPLMHFSIPFPPINAPFPSGRIVEPSNFLTNFLIFPP